MTLQAGSKGLRLASQLARAAESANPSLCRAFATVPDAWGVDSPYHPGTEFLGTPPNHRDLAAKRPVSPHVFEVDQPTKFHYKMPINAVSSIASRVTGAALTATSVGAGALAFQGDLLPVVDFVRDSFLVYPARALVAGPLIYHYLAGLRHLAWDHAKYGMQSERGDLLDPKVVDQTSWAIVGATAVGTLAAVVYSS